MGLQIGINKKTLTKKGNHYLLGIVGEATNIVEESDFIYSILFDENGEILEENIDFKIPSKSLLDKWKKSNAITEKVDLAKASIKALKVLPTLSTDDLVCVEENCKYYANRGSYNYACAMKNNTELVFSAVISKHEKTQFYTELRDDVHTFFRIDEILTEKIKKMLIENMKVHSKERVRLLANGFYFND